MEERWAASVHGAQKVFFFFWGGGGLSGARVQDLGSKGRMCDPWLWGAKMRAESSKLLLRVKFVGVNFKEVSYIKVSFEL